MEEKEYICKENCPHYNRINEVLKIEPKEEVKEHVSWWTKFLRWLGW